MLKSWWMFRYLPPPGQHHFGCPHGRYPPIFEIHWFFKKSCKKLKCWNLDGCVDFCRLRDHHFGSPHGRYPQIFEIHWFFKKSCKKVKFWNPDGCVDFCRLRDSIIPGRRMAGTFRFWKFIGFNAKHAQNWNCKMVMDVLNCAELQSSGSF